MDGTGGGIYAIRSNVSIARCEFNDNFAENLGGGIFANDSVLEVVDSMFRYCEAGFVSTFSDEDFLKGAGGGISVSNLVVRKSTFSAQSCRSFLARVGLARLARFGGCGRSYGSPFFGGECG